MKHLTFILFLLAFIICESCNSQSQQITFQLDTKSMSDVKKVEIFGNLDPLDKTKGLALLDNDGDGIYSINVEFNGPKKKYLKFRFAINGILEFPIGDDRVIWFKEEPIVNTYQYNEYERYSREKIDAISYTVEQIEEDVSILKEALLHIHPNIYKFRDSLSIAQDFEDLELSLKSNPNIEHAFAEISKIINLISCSHTFTNLWNQGATVEKAMLYQDDKLPISFSRIGKRIFVDKNATNNSEIKAGLEILKINGIPSKEVLNKLSAYVSADGNNFNKKLDRLMITGKEKYELFDLFYPIIYGSNSSYDLELYDLQTKSSIEVNVPSMSASKRTMLFKEKYDEGDKQDNQPWKLKFINENTAILTLTTFAFFNDDFDWKNYFDKAIKKLNTQNIDNLIIDIRGNEGGNSMISKYIIERIITNAFSIKELEVSVRYLSIPDHIKKHISTWDKLPYDFTNKYKSKDGDRYFLKPRYGLPSQTFKPRRDGFKGQVYIITDSSNSSATHQFATYCKLLDNVSLVGQETGGNLMGTNGGFIFFLRLPNSKIEVDIPVLSQRIQEESNPRNGGVLPDIPVTRIPEKMNEIEDFELEAILKEIERRKKL